MAKQKAKKKAVKKKTVKTKAAKKKTVKKKTSKKGKSKTKGRAKPAKPKKKKKKKSGGQSKYSVKFPDRARLYAEVGWFSCNRLAKKFKVSSQTIRNWIKDHPKFAEAVKDGKEIAIEAVDCKNYEMALGLVKEKKGYIPPNQKSCISILKANRAEYKDKIQHSGPDGEPIPMQIVSFKDIDDTE